MEECGILYLNESPHLGEDLKIHAGFRMAVYLQYTESEISASSLTKRPFLTLTKLVHMWIPGLWMGSRSP